MPKNSAWTPTGQLAFAPRLIEEDDLDRLSAVTHRDLDHDLALSRATTGDLGDLGKDGRLVADREVAEVDLSRAIDVATGIDGEQVKDVGDAHRLERRRALLTDMAQLVDRHVAQLAKSARRRVTHSRPK